MTKKEKQLLNKFKRTWNYGFKIFTTLGMNELDFINNSLEKIKQEQPPDKTPENWQLEFINYLEEKKKYYEEKTKSNN